MNRKLFIRIDLSSSVVFLFSIFVRLSHAQDLPYVKKATRQETFQASTQAMAQAFAPAQLKQSAWRIIGPFDNTGPRGETATYPPEQELDFQAEYTGRGGEKVRWKDAPQFEDGKAHSLLALAQPSDYVSFYLYRTIEADRETPTVLYLGSDDALAVWVNGEKVLEYRGERAAVPDDDHVKVLLKKGINHVLLKVSNIKGGFGFAYRLSGLSPEQETQLKSWMDQLTERLEEDFPGKEAQYDRIATIPIPSDIVLEVGGLAFLPDGRLAIGTRRGE